MITDENKSHYVYTKDFNRFVCNKTKYKNKKHFCKYCSVGVLVQRKKACLKINGKEAEVQLKIVQLRSGSINFKNHFKQSDLS